MWNVPPTNDWYGSSKPAVEGGAMKYLVLAAVFGVAPIVQTNTAAGVWTAEFNGKTFVKVELHVEGAALAGRISESDVHLDDNGDLRSVGDLPADAQRIFNVKQDGAIVTFSARDEDDTDNFEFRVRDDGRAELRLFLTEKFRAQLAASGIPQTWISKAIVLTRQPR
jgi:hypothetical protein